MNVMRTCKLIISGGGIKCVYQITFLKELLTSNKYNEKYDNTLIYGTSFGALVGFCACINKYDILIKFFESLSVTSLVPWFDLWGTKKYLTKIPFLGNLICMFVDAIWLIISINKKSLYSPETGMKFLDNIDISDCKDRLSNYWCTVYNVTQNKTEWIKGTHPLIKEYITASCSVWVLFPPISIKLLKSQCVCDSNCKFCNKSKHNMDEFCTCKDSNHQFNEFIDGGLCEYIPLHIIEQDIREKTITPTYIFASDCEYTFIFPSISCNHTGSHLFEYLHKLISFLIEKNISHRLTDINKIIQQENLYNIVNIVYYSPVVDNIVYANAEHMKKMLYDGMELGKKYVNLLIN